MRIRSHAFSLLFLLAPAGCAIEPADAPGESAAAVTAFASTCGFDPNDAATLVKLTQKPIVDAHDADVRFSCLANVLHARKDRRAPFATLYSTTTTNVNLAIAAGHFEDGAWTSRYLTSFAELYRAAFFAYETGDRAAVPSAWTIAFDTAVSHQELVVQDLALGVNAHVDRDLAYALKSVGIGAPGAARDRRYRDHARVNDVLHAEIQSALTTIAQQYAPGLGKAPAELLQIFENAFFAALVVGRQNAWNHAVELSDWGSFGRAIVGGVIDAESTAIADGILLPQLDPALLAALRQLEGS